MGAERLYQYSTLWLTAPAQCQEKIPHHISLALGKTKIHIQSKVSTECILLLYFCKVEKIISCTVRNCWLYWTSLVPSYISSFMSLTHLHTPCPPANPDHSTLYPSNGPVLFCFCACELRQWWLCTGYCFHCVLLRSRALFPLVGRTWVVFRIAPTATIILYVLFQPVLGMREVMVHWCKV